MKQAYNVKEKVDPYYPVKTERNTPITLGVLYKKFPNKEECLEAIKEARWHGDQECPKCNSDSFTLRKNKMEYMCYECCQIYSPTSGTLMHKTRVDLQKWFYVICKHSDGEYISGRKLSEIINVNRNTSCLLNKKINEGKDRNFLHNILEIVKEYKIEILVFLAFLFILMSGKIAQQENNKEKGFAVPPKTMESKENKYTEEDMKGESKEKNIVKKAPDTSGEPTIMEGEGFGKFTHDDEPTIEDDWEDGESFGHDVTMDDDYDLDDIELIKEARKNAKDEQEWMEELRKYMKKSMKEDIIRAKRRDILNKKKKVGKK